MQNCSNSVKSYNKTLNHLLVRNDQRSNGAIPQPPAIKYLVNSYENIQSDSISTLIPIFIGVHLRHSKNCWG